MFSNKKISITNTEVIQYWNFNKNIGINPIEIYKNSKQKYWWICSKGHEWESTPRAIARRKNIDYCLICKGNLATNNPELLVEWDYKKNNKLPHEYLSSSHQKVWWNCKKGHSWFATIDNRARLNCGCPLCSNYYWQKSRIELMFLYEFKYIFPQTIGGYKVDKKEIDIFIPEINLAIEMDGSYWHKNIEKRDLIKNDIIKKSNINLIRVREYPLKKINEVDIVYSVKENKLDVFKKILKTIEQITNKDLSQYINMQEFNNIEEYYKILSSQCKRENCLLLTHPEVSKEWHPTKNHRLTPEDVSQGSTLRVYWSCSKCKNEYDATICNRSKSGCPYCKKCSKKLWMGNSFVDNFPNIAKEWNYDKNINLKPENERILSHKNVWWKCENGHEWKRKIRTRTKNNSSCPFCL